MRTYIIGNDGIALCRETPAAVNDGEINEKVQLDPAHGFGEGTVAGASAMTRMRADKGHSRGRDRAAGHALKSHPAVKPICAGKPSEGQLDRGEGDNEWNLSTRVRFVSETGCAWEIYGHRRPRDFD